MNQQELKELIDLVIEKGIAEFELEREDVKVRIKRAGDQSAPAVQYIPTPVIGSAPVIATPAAAPAPSTAPSYQRRAPHVAQFDQALRTIGQEVIEGPLARPVGLGVVVVVDDEIRARR